MGKHSVIFRRTRRAMARININAQLLRQSTLLVSISFLMLLPSHEAHAQTQIDNGGVIANSADQTAQRLNDLLKKATKTPVEQLVPTPVTGDPDAPPSNYAIATGKPIYSGNTTDTANNNSPTEVGLTPPAMPAIPGLPALPSMSTDTSNPATTNTSEASTSESSSNIPALAAAPVLPNPEAGVTATAPQDTSLSGASNDPTATPLRPEEAASTADAQNQAALLAAQNGQVQPLAPADAAAQAATTGGLPPLPALPMPNAIAPDASALPPVVDANVLAVANPSAPLPSLAFDDLDSKEKAAKNKKSKKKKKKKSSIAFDYHRQELPPTISKAAYNMDNRHLPTAMYWQKLEMDMFYAAREGNVNIMRALVTKGVSVNLHNQIGEPLITLAARYGRTNVVHWLIVHGSRVNDVSAQGQTPLHVAVSKGDAKMVKVLLDGGADPNMPDERGIYPLAMASDRGMSDTSTVLKEYGAM